VSIFSHFFPDFCFAKVEEITPQFLREKRIDALILDVDNTLTPWGKCKITDEVKEWVRELRQNGIQLVPHGFRKALKELESAIRTTAVVGDIVFTDVVGANLLGLRSILVEPISKRDFFGTKLWRLMENLFKLRRPKGKGGIR